MPGVYEGGLKVWEASLDLVEHLVSPVGGLCAQNEATGVTGRRRNVLEVLYCYPCTVPLYFVI